FGVLLVAPDVASQPRGGAPVLVVVTADLDDDDANGKVDGLEDALAPHARTDLVPLERSVVGWELKALRGAENARIISADGRPIAWSKAAPQGASVQGLRPGTVAVVATRGKEQVAVTIEVRGLGFRDGAQKTLDLVRDHASIQRTPPA